MNNQGKRLLTAPAGVASWRQRAFAWALAHLNAKYERTVASYKNAEDAHRMENLWTLCGECHKRKTENDRQMESRMR